MLAGSWVDHDYIDRLGHSSRDEVRVLDSRALKLDSIIAGLSIINAREYWCYVRPPRKNV